MKQEFIKLCGFSIVDGVPVPLFGGAFQMADTMGFPLLDFMNRSFQKGCGVSLPHYFASAIEHGWDDKQTFAKISEALGDMGRSDVVETVKKLCMAMYMETAKETNLSDPVEIARAMRIKLENI